MIEELTKTIKMRKADGKRWYDYVECCAVLALSPSNMRYCIPNEELATDNKGVIWITEDALWKNLYKQSRQYYIEKQMCEIYKTTPPLF